MGGGLTFFLTNAEDAAECLLLDTFVPIEIKEDDFGGHGEVQADAAGFETAQQDFLFVLFFEIFDGFIAGIEVHCPSELAALPTFVVAYTG